MIDPEVFDRTVSILQAIMFAGGVLFLVSLTAIYMGRREARRLAEAERTGLNNLHTIRAPMPSHSEMMRDFDAYEDQR